MKLKEIDRDQLRKEIVSRIEAEFAPDVIAHWVGTGCPDDDFKDDTERFEAYMVEGRDLERFIHFVRLLRKEIGKPHGFSIMVHPLNAENTTNFHLKEYEAEKARRISLSPVHSKSPGRKSPRSGKRRHPEPAKKLNNKLSKS
jgi:hypothetical protein